MQRVSSKLLYKAKIMYFYNSLTRQEDLFVPLDGRNVTLYVCGITPYDTTHLGHAFTYIAFDVLIRYLKFTGYNITYTQNVTDINDRDKDILQRAKEKNILWSDLANVATEKFLKNMKDLNWIMPTNYLKASENIKPVIDLIQKLLANGFAYEKNGSVYFDIEKDKEYGKLSGFSKEEMLTIAKNFDEDLDNSDKRNKLDITLWRAMESDQEGHIPHFESPFGPGRPGWHIECSAMSASTLGQQIDIHGGGIDLLFPHHEAEIAQSEAAIGKKPFVKYWIHTGNIFYAGEKMSKSKGNLVLVSDLLQKYSANAIRWTLLSHHYQKDWEFEEKELIDAEKTMSKISGQILGNKSSPDNKSLWKNFNNLMSDNLDTPKVLELVQNATEKGEIDFVKKALEVLGF